NYFLHVRKKATHSRHTNKPYVRNVRATIWMAQAECSELSDVIQHQSQSAYNREQKVAYADGETKSVHQTAFLTAKNWREAHVEKFHAPRTLQTASPLVVPRCVQETQFFRVSFLSYSKLPSISIAKQKITPERIGGGGNGTTLLLS
ncbi:unnamed protein product, partial [Ectocarpus sp. 6 AP-2014]